MGKPSIEGANLEKSPRLRRAVGSRIEMGARENDDAGARHQPEAALTIGCDRQHFSGTRQPMCSCPSGPAVPAPPREAASVSHPDRVAVLHERKRRSETSSLI